MAEKERESETVAVVFCRDCRKMKTFECTMQSCGYDDFCSQGERRDDNDGEP